MMPLLRKPKWVVLANGDFPTHELPLSFLKKAEKIICCDGATQHLLEYGLQPDFIIGDMDSISDEIKKHFSLQIIEDSSQETNDLTKALDFCCKKQVWNEITIVGATGKREDHTLGNIALLTRFVRNMEIQLLTDHGIFVSIEKTTTLESYPKQQISIFNLTPNVSISSTNLAYPLQNRLLNYWWEGTLNEATEDQFTIKINYSCFQENIARVIIFREYPKDKISSRRR
ncbi:putative thiamine pyrophosphokinase [Candidatus Azobacteroides pseudotrichonymphae genomovar. CFP2]|uniref:Thiamine diphosphokinase n=2 Tax=Candidatus Azobacteroides TaxID=511434 RepID=B6YQE1_AZOPC|nr:putative thiamine pyrophosphokinase [Candidatus Azobacteroides pseudotrichonymphae genomovar. CFP2]